MSIQRVQVISTGTLGPQGVPGDPGPQGTPGAIGPGGSFTPTTTKRHIWFPGTNDNYPSVPLTRPVDASFDVRVETTRPAATDLGVRRAMDAGIYIGWSSGGIANSFQGADATFPGHSVSLATVNGIPGFPGYGAPVQLRMEWNHTTDTLTSYWRAPGVDLLNNVGWTVLTSSVHAGKALTSAGTTIHLNNSINGWAVNGAGYRWTVSMNGSLVIDVNPEVNLVGVAVDAPSFVATTGQTVTLFRSGSPALRLVNPTLFLEGADTQVALTGLGLEAAMAIALAGPGERMRGVGSPEGTRAAPVGTIYVDTAATNGAVLWVKASGVAATGWQVVYGDTGWRILLQWNSSGVFTHGTGFVSPDLAPRPGQQGWVRIRRAGQQVRAVVSNLSAGPSGLTVSTQYAAVATPSGFAPAGSENLKLGTYNQTVPNVPFRSSSADIGFQCNATQPANQLIVAWAQGIEWTADLSVPWPTTLPGTAA